MGSTARNDFRPAMFLERIARAWDKRRDLTFGALLAGALDGSPSPRDLLDEEIALAIERFVMYDPGPR